MGIETRAPRIELQVVGWNVGPAPETVDMRLDQAAGQGDSGAPCGRGLEDWDGTSGLGRDIGTGTLFSEREERIRLLNRRSQREQRSEEDFGFGSSLCFLCDLLFKVFLRRPRQKRLLLGRDTGTGTGYE